MGNIGAAIYTALTMLATLSALVTIIILTIFYFLRLRKTYFKKSLRTAVYTSLGVALLLGTIAGSPYPTLLPILLLICIIANLTVAILFFAIISLLKSLATK